VLLQLFDEGRLTDSHGRTVDFRNVIVIMTSNMGAQVFADLPLQYKGSEPEVVESIMDIVRRTLSPELLNRIDECIVFNRLQRENMDVIADIGLDEISQRLSDRQNMMLDVSKHAKSALAERGYDPRYGARPLKRTLAKDVLNPLSRLVLEQSIQEGETVKVRTRAEAIKEDQRHGWVCSNPRSENKNDIVLLRNHPPKAQEERNEVDTTQIIPVVP
jgi:ATP-dependent Clp protease ATP-binding subunit ClpA